MDQSPQSNSSTPSTSFVPTTWPGAFGAYKFSRDAVKFNLGTILGLLATTILLTVLIDSVFKSEFLNQVLGGLFNVWLGAATTYAILKSVQGVKVAFGDSLTEGLSLFWNYLLLSLATFVLLVGSFVLFIIPFFFVLPRVVLAPYFLVDKQMGPVEALKASWNATKGYSGKVWGMIGASILMALGIIILIGLYFLVMYSAVFAVFYFFLSKNSQSAPQA